MYFSHRWRQTKEGQLPVIARLVFTGVHGNSISVSPSPRLLMSGEAVPLEAPGVQFFLRIEKETLRLKGAECIQTPQKTYQHLS